MRARCDEGNLPGRVWYLPHHGVVNSNRPEKFRVVHDTSAEFKGVSLNNSLLKKRDLLTSLLGVFFQFRDNRIPLSADIAKMYFQICSSARPICATVPLEAPGEYRGPFNL